MYVCGRQGKTAHNVLQHSREASWKWSSRGLAKRVDFHGAVFAKQSAVSRHTNKPRCEWNEGPRRQMEVTATVQDKRIIILCDRASLFDSDLILPLLLHFVWTAEWTGQGGVGTSKSDGAKDDQLFRYLLGSPDPSHLMMTECHHHRRVTSHSLSSGFPGPGSWWTACLWEGPPPMLEGGNSGRSVKIQSTGPEQSDWVLKWLIWKLLSLQLSHLHTLFFT